MLLAVAVALPVVAGLLLALPRGRGCLAQVLRLVALAGAVAAPIVLAWPALGERRGLAWLAAVAVLLVAALVAVVLSAGAATLLATGWQGLLRGHAAIEREVDLSLFDPSAYTGLPSRGGTHPDDDPFGNCLFAVVLGMLGGTLWLGLQVSRAIATRWLPRPRTGWRRAARAALSLAYGAPLSVVALWLLLSLDGPALNPARGWARLIGTPAPAPGPVRAELEAVAPGLATLSAPGSPQAAEAAPAWAAEGH